ncbi:DJ-1/PfpI family protein [Methylomonas methanica]|uniref:Glutamine amidotransferase n=1 Tax=Methylomonas methanica TaxID=421 RepID=A0A177LRZ0_METMH|nr:DJ-1/PfpI family protein [Methylomonas methanica]OAH96277.1 glutamine amidotransferase [Methylomonas methanica]OAI10260.1 glutamine amidotransferase [Methylomonas methanica]
MQKQPQPLQFGMLLYPGFTLLDLVGPQTAFSLNGQTHLIWKNMDPVLTDVGVSMNPSITFDDVPNNLDVLFVPGGFGTVDAMQDKEILEFLAHAGSTARYITSVCTGSVLLGMAGLLEGYRAATHWAFYEPLEALGIEASHERVSVDRNRITGGGITAGIDLGLIVIANLKGQDAAEFTQLAMEYDPQPPLNAGHPRTARKEIVDMISGAKGIMAEMTSAAVKIAKLADRKDSSQNGQ